MSESEGAKKLPLATPNLGEWKTMLETLFPSGETLVISDCVGNEYKLSAVLPAKREVLLFRKLGEISNLPIGQWAGQMKEASSQGLAGQVGAIVAMIAGAVGDDRVVILLCEAVLIGYPQLLTQALEKIRAKEDQKAILEGIDSPTLADIFGLTELVRAVLPFVTRPAGKALGALEKLTALSPAPKT